VTVTGTGTIAPTGTVQFQDNSVNIGTPGYTTTGNVLTATISGITLTRLTHTISATYNPGTDPNYITNSTSITITFMDIDDSGLSDDDPGPDGNDQNPSVDQFHVS
jgi:hypothetical protein